MENINIHTLLDNLGQYVMQFSMRLLIAVVILCCGLWLSGRITRSVKRVMQMRKLDVSLQSFLASFINIALKTLVVIVVLTTVGVQMTSIVAVLAAASLAVGMALSGTLQNFAGGIVILLFKPFKIGDMIETAEHKTGTVKKILIFTTELHTFDNQILYLPNGPLANGIITNLSQGGTRRSDLKISISYGDNIDVARNVILEILSSDTRILQKPEPVVFMDSLGDSAVVLNVRYWTKTMDMWDSNAYVLEQIYKILPKKKISFPFPQMDVHIVK